MFYWWFSFFIVCLHAKIHKYKNSAWSSYASSYVVLDTAVTKIQILAHSMNAKSMSRLVQPQDCLKSADNVVVKRHRLRPPASLYVIMTLIFPQGLWTSSLTEWVNPKSRSSIFLVRLLPTLHINSFVWTASQTSKHYYPRREVGGYCSCFETECLLMPSDIKIQSRSLCSDLIFGLCKH